jgi:hypothetical protein
MTLDVLGTMRAIRDDRELSTTQAHLLMCALLRADNTTCKVRYSIEKLAVDAKVSDKTARTAFKNDKVLKYLEKVDRATRQVNMWFHSTPVILTPVMVTGVTPVTVSTTPVIEDTDSGNCVHDSGNGYRPSTLSSTLSSTFTSTESDESQLGEEGVSSLPNFETTTTTKEELMNKQDAGMRTTKVSDGQAFSDGEQCFNYFEASLSKKTGKPSLVVWQSVKMGWLAVMRDVTKEHAFHLIDVWLASDATDSSQAAFLRTWTKVYDTDISLTEDKQLRDRLAVESKARSEAWKNRPSTKVTTAVEPEPVPLSLEEQRRAFNKLFEEDEVNGN